MTIATSRTARQERIAEILSRTAVRSQTELHDLLVQDGIHDTFVRKLADAAARLKLGDGLAPGVDVGPLIDAEAVAKVEEHVADALAKGASLAVGGYTLGSTAIGIVRFSSPNPNSRACSAILV